MYFRLRGCASYPLYCIVVCVCLEFVSSDSARTTLGSVVQLGNRKLNVCHALTPPHMYTWTHANPVTMKTNGEEGVSEEVELAGLVSAQVKLIQPRSQE